MNVILCDAEEFRRVRVKKGDGPKEEKEEKRSMGLVLLRGETIVTMTVEGPPPHEDNPRVNLPMGGPGTSRQGNLELNSILFLPNDTFFSINNEGDVFFCHLCNKCS